MDLKLNFDGILRGLAAGEAFTLWGLLSYVTIGFFNNGGDGLLTVAGLTILLGVVGIEVFGVDIKLFVTCFFISFFSGIILGFSGGFLRDLT